MEFKSIKKFDRVLALVLTIAALLAGQSVWAASTFTVSSPQNNNTFRITRTGNTAVSETIDWRVVSLSAIAGVHFTGYNGNYSGTVTFNVNDTYKDVTISESAPGDNAYKYQDGTSRSYRFEVLDRNGDILASKDRSITSGLTQFSAAKVSSSISNLVTMSSGNFSSGMSSSKYVDVSYTPPTSDVQTSKQDLPGYVLIDDSYDYAQKPATVSTSTIINSTGASASYLNTQQYKIYATVCFTEKERDDGYQYLQIIAGNSAASYDTGADNNGQVYDPVNSVYKVCFELADGSSSEGKAYFPHRGTGADEFSISTGKLHQQKYKSGYDGNGSVILPVTTSYITTRFDAGGDNDDTWGYKNFFVRMALCDATAPTVLNTNGYVVSGGRHQRGNTIYVSVPFSEIVTVTGTPTLASNWGTLSYTAGSGSNVLTFKGEISSDATGTFSVTGYSGTIKDLAGNALSGSISHNFGTTLDSNYTWSTSDFNTLADGSYEIYTTQDLRHLALMVNSGNNNCSGLTFKQTHDITYTHTTNWNNSSSTENNFTAIGPNDSNPFCGTYDGDGHTISGIRIYKGSNSDIGDCQGLFGLVGSGGTVRRVTLADARITGFNCTGGIAGKTFSCTIEDCTVGADVCIHAVKIDAFYHGGIVGYNQKIVRRCISRATLSVKDDLTGCKNFGGIVGFNNGSNGGTITDCIADGVVIPDVNGRGAILGVNNNGSLTRNYYRGCTVAGVANATGVGQGTSNSSTETSDPAGARVLYALSLPANTVIDRTPSATLPGSGNKTYTTGADIDGTPYAYATATLRLSYTGAAPAEGYTYALYINGVQATDNGDGTYTATMPAADATVTVSTVVIPWSGSGDSENAPYLIQYRSQLDLLATNVNAGNNYSGKFFQLGADITYAHTTNWNDANSTEGNYTAIGNQSNGFSGTFDGFNHTISGVRIYTNSDGLQGLFGYVDGGTVKNIKLTDARITGTYDIGGLVGKIGSGSVQNCLVRNAAVTANSNSAGAVVGYKYYGSLSHNYYQGCIVKGGSMTYTTGVGLGSPKNDFVNEVVSLHALTLPTGVTATGESVTIGTDTYYVRYTTITLNIPTGYVMSSASYNDGTDHDITGNTFTMPAADVTVSATLTDLWDITSDKDGTTAEKAYTITTTAGLDLLATLVNGGNNFDGKYFKLGADITYTNTTDWNDATSTENNYTAIGGYVDGNWRYFRGTFDGQNHTVRGIRIYKDGTTNADSYQGLFGMTSGATIRNVILTDARITGRQYVGGIAGYVDSNTLTNNYYYNCTVGGATTNVGIGAEDDNETPHDRDGARSVHTLTLGTGITATGESVTNGTDIYYASNTTVTLNAPTGYVISAASYSDGADHNITGNTFTMPAADVTVSATLTDVWDITSDKDGSTAEKAYTITSTAGLDLLATLVNDGNNFDGKYFKLGADITYTHTTNWNDATSTENNYTAIGGYVDGHWRYFGGTFDGQNHTVRGIRIYKGGTTNADGYQGLFGRTIGATIRNVILADARITGKQYVGGIAGYTESAETGGIVENCRVGSDVCIHAVADHAYYHGGVVGDCNGGTISGCVSSATLTVTNGLTSINTYGGIVGSLGGNMSDCLSIDVSVPDVNRNGAIAGDVARNRTLTNNYYYNCTVGGATTSVGVGSEQGNTTSHDRDGAYSVHSLTLPTGVTATGESVTIGTDTYYVRYTTVTLNIPTGYVMSSASYYDGTDYDITDNTFTMPAADVTVTADYIMTWASLKSAMQNGGTFTLPYDITATETDTYLYVPSGKTVTLDLNGHTINRNLTAAANNGYVIGVNGTLTINDSSDSNTGSITGGYNNYGGGVYVWGTFTMNGGTVTGNTATTGGGGVYVQHGTFNMSGGTISNNSGSWGGGVYVQSTFNMSGGTISNNSGSWGGGVYVQSTFNMSGGTVTCNTATSGGGVYVYNDKTINISGNPVITGNTLSNNTTANNVYLKPGSVITVTDALTNTANIGVIMQNNTGAFTTGLDSNGTAANFTSDASAYLVYPNDSGEAALDVAYSVNIDDGITNGTVTTNQVTTVAGTIVTLIVTPSIGYSINTVSYNDGTDHEITAVNDVYSFTMPAGNVTVTATFSDVWGMAGGADGTVQHPYTITTTAGLDQLATLVNSGNEFQNKFFKLNADITYSHKADNEEGADTENNFTTIGVYIQEQFKCFCGILDGQGHTISGIRIYKGGDSSSDDNQGLFRWIYRSEATIKNVILADTRITGRFHVGGIVGNIFAGTVENCRVGSDVTIHAATNYADCHGGVVGVCNQNGTIRGCVSSAILTVADGLTDISCFGGIVGAFDGNMSDCLALDATMPAVTKSGAIAGSINARISTQTNCYHRDCTVGGNGAPSNTYNVSAYTVSAGTYVTMAPAGSADTIYEFNGIQRYGDALYYGVIYAPEDADVSLTLGYNGSVPTDLSVGYAPSTGSLSISSNPYTLNMSDGDVTINAFFGVEVPYIDEKGVEHIATAIPLDNTMMTLAAGTYVVNSDVTYTSTVTTTGDVTLILADGCTMSYGTENDYLDNTFIYCPGNLTIYGQVQGTGLLKAYGNHYGISVSKDYTQHSGNVFIRNMNGCCITTGKDFTLLGGTLDLLGGHFCDGDIEAFRFMNIQGGKLWARYKGLYSGVGIINLDYTKPSDLIYAKKYNSIPSIADDKTFVNEGGKAISRTLYPAIVDVTNKTLRPVMGVTLTKDGNNISATFSGTSLETVNIPAPGVTVKEVTYNRTFSADKASTVMLPFDYTCNGNEGGTFYRFVGVEKENNIWVATMQLTSNALTANTPYLFLPTGTGITFTIPNEGVTLCTEGGGGGQTADSGSHWTFKGTNSYIKWTTNTNDPDYSAERAAEIGKVYGFAGVDKNEIKAGDFVKVASGAKIRPMSAYLIWSNTANLAPARGGMNAASASADELPKSITVRLINANGTVTNVGEIDTVTGEISFEGWYTLQGVKLDAEPTEPGVYINNGKTVSIQK